MNFLRALVRPLTTILLVVALVVYTGLYVVGIAAKDVPDWFVGLAGLVLGYWFGARTAERARQG